jgi:hypothetical protein
MKSWGSTLNMENICRRTGDRQSEKKKGCEIVMRGLRVGVLVKPSWQDSCWRQTDGQIIKGMECFSSDPEGSCSSQPVEAVWGRDPRTRCCQKGPRAAWLSEVRQGLSWCSRFLGQIALIHCCVPSSLCLKVSLLGPIRIN